MQIDHYLTPEDLAASLRADVRAGLTASPKVLPPKYFYDGAAASCSRRSPGCRSTTRPGPRRRSSTSGPTTSPT